MLYNPLLLPELREMLSTGDEEELSAVMTELHPATIADFSEGLSVEETWQLLDHASVERQAEVFSFFPLDKQVEMVSGVGPRADVEAAGGHVARRSRRPAEAARHAKSSKA